MSVLKPRRKESATEYLRVANDLFSWSVNFCSRLSARYSRLLSNMTIDAASELLSSCVKANNSYPKGYEYAKMREFYLVKAIGALDTLDIMMSHIYGILMLNPEGAFSKSNGKSVPEKDAVERLNAMCSTIGGLINKEKGMLVALRKSAHDKVSSFGKQNEVVVDFSSELEGQMKMSEFEFDLEI